MCSSDCVVCEFVCVRMFVCVRERERVSLGLSEKTLDMAAFNYKGCLNRKRRKCRLDTTSGSWLTMTTVPPINSVCSFSLESDTEYGPTGGKVKVCAFMWDNMG